MDGGAKPAFGNLTRDRVKDAAAVLISSSGSGGSDQYVAVYTNGNKRRLGTFDPATSASALDSEIYHAYVTCLRIKRGKVRVEFTTDTYCGYGRLAWKATLRWNGHRLKSSITPLGEPQPAC